MVARYVSKQTEKDSKMFQNIFRILISKRKKFMEKADVLQIVVFPEGLVLYRQRVHHGHPNLDDHGLAQITISTGVTGPTS